MEDLISSFRDVLMLLLGASIAFLSGYFVWRRQMKEERRRRREEYLMNAIQLALSSLTYTRALIYAKPNDIEAVSKLPENPVDKLMAVVFIHFPSVFSYAQQLHKHHQTIYQQPMDAPNATEILFKTAEECGRVVSDL